MKVKKRVFVVLDSEDILQAVKALVGHKFPELKDHLRRGMGAQLIDSEGMPFGSFDLTLRVEELIDE